MKHMISTQTAGGKMPEDEKFRMIAQAGFEAIDLGFFEYADWNYCTKGEGQSVFDLPDGEALEFFSDIGRKAAYAGLKIGQTHAPFPSNVEEGLKAVVTDAGIRMLRLSVTATGMMGCPYIVVHPAFNGTVKYLSDPAALSEIWELNREMYLSLVPAAREAGVVICLENMWQWDPWPDRIIPGLLSRGKQFAEWIDRLNDEAGEERFAACLDTGHALLTGEDLPEMIGILGNRIKTLHMHDVIENNDLHTAPFDGICDWKTLAASLREVGYDGTLNFETLAFQLRRPPELYAATCDFLAKTAAWFRDLID